MSMTGGISFFDKNKAFYSEGSTCVASSNTASQNLILGSNKYFKWESIGSNDTTTETLTITLPAAISISRLFLVDHNFKEFTIKYGSTPSDFAAVKGIGGYTDSKIAHTAFSGDTAYYEFTPVTTDTIVISVVKSQVANAQKYLNQFIVTNELGTLSGFPNMNGIKLDRNDQRDEAISGRVHIEKGYETATFNLDLNTYPYQADVTLLDSLHDRDLPFIVWLSGGISTQFKITQRGFRLKDVYQMKVTGSMNNSYYKNIYKSGVNQNYNFAEVVQ